MIRISSRYCTEATAPVLGMACAGAQMAETAPGTRLAPIVVSAARGAARDAEDLPLSVTVIRRELIERSPGRTVDELLREVVGIQLPVQNSTAGFPANPGVSIQSLGLGDNGTRTLMLLDGIPMNGAYFGNAFWNRVPRQNIERIEIERGASSSLFGAYAMGGVINIVTRDPPDSLRAQINELRRKRLGGSRARHARTRGRVRHALQGRADEGGCSDDPISPGEPSWPGRRHGRPTEPLLKAEWAG